MTYKFKILIAVACILAISMYVAKAKFIAEDEPTLTLKEVHKNLFDLYFPSDASLSTVQQMKRRFYREVVWHKVKDNKELMVLLNPIKHLKGQLSNEILSEFKDIVDYGFKKAGPKRQDEFSRRVMQTGTPKQRKYLFRLRQTWLYIIYSIPLVNEIAGVSLERDHPVHDVEMNLPPSKLRFEGSEIFHEDGPVDYLVIGSGAAGSVIAHELTRQIPEARVVLVESGAFVKPRSTFTELSSELMEANNDRRNTGGGIIIRNGKTVGGGTTVNLDLAFSPLLPQIKSRFQEWMKEGRIPEIFFHEKDVDWQKLQFAYEWVKDHVYTRQITDAEINKNNRLLKDGHPLAQVYNLNQRKPSFHKGEILKISSTEAFILPALRGGSQFKGNLSLIPDAKVVQINFEDRNNSKKATGANIVFRAPLKKDYVAADINGFGNVEGKNYTIRAKNVVVSAGALGSAEILLKSDLNNDAIGRGIIIHPSMGILGQFEHEINGHEGLSASVYAPSSDGGYIFEAMTAEPQFIALIHPGSGVDRIRTLLNYKKLGGFGIMLVDSVNKNNRVVLNHYTGSSEIIYAINASDKLRIREGLKKGVNILFSQGAKEVLIPTAENIYEKDRFEPFTSPSQANKAIDRLQLVEGLNFVSAAHMQGSNKLGGNSFNSVVSPRFKVWDTATLKEIPNLYVCDSSVFPTSVGANPMQSVYTIAKLFIDQILIPSHDRTN